jgi:predicted transcriptional regulator
MQEENLLKMSEMATPPVMETYTASILICYLLYKIDRPIERAHLYDIAVSSNIINYFFYQESISYLEKNGSIIQTETDDGKTAYVLAENGVQCAKQLRDYVSKAYRDKMVSCALKYFAKLKRENEVKIEYIPIEHGYYVHVRCLDALADILDMKLYAPDLTQAKYLGEQIMLNPAGFYGKILDAAFQNEEEKFDFDLSDN